MIYFGTTEDENYDSRVADVNAKARVVAYHECSYTTPDWKYSSIHEGEYEEVDLVALDKHAVDDYKESVTQLTRLMDILKDYLKKDIEECKKESKYYTPRRARLEQWLKDASGWSIGTEEEDETYVEVDSATLIEE